jgi:ATP-dependent helicase/nuclease subunit A
MDFTGKFAVVEYCRHFASRYVPRDHESAASKASELINRFVASPRGQQLMQARQVHREVEFLLPWPPGEANPLGCYIRGYIDCLYQDADGAWHIVDYKTNQVAKANVPQVSGQYELQLYVYAMAAEHVLGQPPIELVLYFLQPGAERSFAWNDDARHGAMDKLSQRIASITASDWSLH